MARKIVIVKVRGRKGIVTHKYYAGVDRRAIEFYRGQIGKKLYATSQSQLNKYGGRQAKVISVQEVKPIQRKQRFQQIGFFSVPQRRSYY